MRLRATSRRTRTVEAGRRSWLAGLFAVSLALLAAVPAFAQGWWPWSGQQQERGPPVPREPVYKEPDQYRPPEDYGPAPPPEQDGGAPYPEEDQQGALPQRGQPQPQQGAGTWSGRTNICQQLEQRLVQEGQRGKESRNIIPMLENELRQVDGAVRATQRELDRNDCYDYFLFSKTLRKTRRCVDLANDLDANRRRQDDLENQRRQLEYSSGQSYQDDIVRELARNNCGSNYEQQARRSANPFSSLWEDEESPGGGGGYGNFGNLPYATYRTVCVRLCDGYYFPVSFSTLPNHFQRDAEVCQSKCAAPSELYYYQNPGAGMDQAVAARTNELYTQLKSAFRYRKEYVQGCSCKTAEYVPEPGDPAATPVPPERQGAISPPAKDAQAAPGATAAPPAAAAQSQRRADAPPAGDPSWQPR
jgi:hypothetical protein